MIASKRQRFLGAFTFLRTLIWFGQRLHWKRDVIIKARGHFVMERRSVTSRYHGSKHNDDGNGNDHWRKSNMFMQAKQQLCTCDALFCTFLGRRCTTTKWHFLTSSVGWEQSTTLKTVLSDSTPENFANIWQIKWNWIDEVSNSTNSLVKWSFQFVVIQKFCHHDNTT